MQACQHELWSLANRTERRERGKAVTLLPSLHSPRLSTNKTVKPLLASLASPGVLDGKGADDANQPAGVNEVAGGAPLGDSAGQGYGRA